MMLEPLWGWFALVAVRVIVLIAEVVRGSGTETRRYPALGGAARV
jgi:hypothetical protein